MSLALDTTHSGIEFSVRHMGLATVRGRFTKFDVKATADAAGIPTSIEVDIDAASITTGVEGRDNHLRSPDFFDVASYPTITFRSTAIERKGDDLEVHGDLTIRGSTKPAVFHTEATGFMKDPWGNQRTAAEGTGKINRAEFGLTWNQALETGGLLVSEDVKFSFSVQLVDQAQTAA
ncbi:MAG: YceI family protein [Trueperaceae bacterium]|nr:YceI family protein [Trueperaceae bacterium]